MINLYEINLISIHLFFLIVIIFILEMATTMLVLNVVKSQNENSSSYTVNSLCECSNHCGQFNTKHVYHVFTHLQIRQ